MSTVADRPQAETSLWKFAPLGALLGAAFFWSYWPTLVALVTAWNKEADYSHGYLVPPLAAYLMYMRRDSMPRPSLGFHWGGLALLVASYLLRIFAARYYVDAIDGWSILVWLAGSVWLLCGQEFFWWCLPSIGFLFFMIPLPYQAETALSVPLQYLAGVLSCWMLQSLGQPALVEGNTILLGDYRLEVEQACSGLRMFVSFIALGVAYTLLVKRPLWQKVTIFLAILPIALVSNALRITATGMLFQYAGDEAARRFSHDAAGWVMIPIGALFFGLLLWYLGKLVIEVETVPPQELVGGKVTPAPGAGA